MAVVRGVYHDPLLQPGGAPGKAGGPKKAALGNITNRQAGALGQQPLGTAGPVKPGSSTSGTSSRSSSSSSSSSSSRNARPKALVYSDAQNDSENKGVQQQRQQPGGGGGGGGKGGGLKAAPQPVKFVIASAPALPAGPAPAPTPSKAAGKGGESKSLQPNGKRQALGAISVNATPAKPAPAAGPVKPKAAAPAPASAPAPAVAVAAASSSSQRVHVLRDDDDGAAEVFLNEPEAEPHTVDLRQTQSALNKIAAKQAATAALDGPTATAAAADVNAYFSQFTAADVNLDAEIAAGVGLDDDISGFGALDALDA